jgi:hypothetical protein
MGGKSGPDYGDLAVQQGEANEGVVRDQTYANRPTQYTPFGYTDWQANSYTDPASQEEVTRWEQTQGLTPELQDILNKQIAIQGGKSDVAGSLIGRMGGEFGQAMDWRGLNPMGQVPTSQFTLPEGGIDDPYQTRQAAEDASYNQAASRLDPRFASQRKNLEAKMRNQGIGPEDAAWKSQMEGLGQQENDAKNQAMWSANQAGRAESGQMFGQQLGLNQNTFNQALGANQQNFGQAMQGSQYANQIRQQQLTESMQKRGFSLNEINALLSGQQVNAPQMPNFSQAGAAQAAPTYQAGVDQGNYDAASSPMNGLMGLAGSGLGAYGTYAGLAAQ